MPAAPLPEFMVRICLPVALAAAAFSAGPVYELSGQVTPQGRATVALHGATRPFSTATLSDESGRFTFKKLHPGTYTVAVFVAGRGETRQTVEVGPGAADSRGRVFLTLRLGEPDFTAEPARRRHSVSARELAIPEKALRDYRDAQKDLEKHDVDAAVRHLEHAVALAPQFAMAWNNLGTIAYQTHRFPRAEECFREALRQDPSSFEPLVNLGGVLVTLHKLDEALEHNVHATLTRPNDALANAQLGMTYFELGQFDSAVKYLERARRIDPTHFSHPQLFLAEIHLRRGQKREAALVLEEFLKHHPDYPQAETMRRSIVELRQ